jgi:type I restriction enzyme R subunit
MAINLLGRGGAFAARDGDDVEEDAADALDMPIHAFDVVIADECHRGYTSAELSVWRRVLDHFDAVRIGLTATPAAHTAAYFRDIVYRYDYERAVAEGYLVDYDAVKVRSGVLMEGVFLKEGEEVGIIEGEVGQERLDLLEDERAYDASDVERQVTAPDTNRKVVREIARYAREHEERTGHFPKTLIFAVNDLPFVSHADQLVQLCREEFARGDAFVAKITGNANVDRPLQRIREFRNRPQPGVVVTVDMLSTGVDIPALEFLVFLRPVKSRILFTQMLGRGTRRCEEIGKASFTVFDCFDGTLLEYFRSTTDFTVEPPEKPTRPLHEIIEDIWQNRDRDYHVRVLVKRLRRVEKEMSGAAREQFAAYVPDGDVGAFAEELPRLVRQRFTETLQLLRDPGFQDLCLTYPRPRRQFVVAYGVQDTVSSELLFRTTDGRALKPYDYLAAFARFVVEHESDIDAIAVLLDRPSGWNTERLHELRQALQRTPERFTEDNLRRAYNQELADVISMVRYAAQREPALHTAAERAAGAVEKVSAGRALTAEQQQWLERISRHLAENLTIERADFEELPVFADYGGWGRANRAFNGNLESLLRQCNEAMAA